MTYWLRDVMVEDDLLPGAYNAVNVCLQVRPEEKVTVVTDQRTRDIGMSIYAEAQKLGARCTMYVLEDFAERPHKDMPQPILDDLQSSQVSVSD